MRIVGSVGRRSRPVNVASRPFARELARLTLRDALAERVDASALAMPGLASWPRAQTAPPR
jgi:hypothetical protein